MKKLIFLILLLFAANVAFSQITTNVSLKCQVYATSGTAPVFNIQSIVADELSKYDGSDVSAGDKLYVIEGSECYELHISSVTLGAGSSLNFVVYDSTGTLVTVPNGQAAVIRKYNVQQVPFIPSGLRNDLASCILQKLASVIDGIALDGNGIYSGSDTLTVGDTTVVTVLAGSALKVGNTIQSPSEITTVYDNNKWGIYNGWDRVTYSYGGFSGYYFIRGNGTAANKQALSINDALHEWAFIGQKSPTETNYALILKPTVDEITGGNNWGRLDLQGADFQTWLSLRRTGIRAGSAANFTTFPAQRPVSASFWEHAADGTGSYKTPGQMVVTNPLGGSNALQATLDSLYQSSNQIIVAADSFYINDQDQPVYLVAAGDTITIPQAAEYTAGAGIDISISGVISADDDSPTNEIQTLSILGNDITLSDGGGTVTIPSSADGNGIISSLPADSTFISLPQKGYNYLQISYKNIAINNAGISVNDSIGLKLTPLRREAVGFFSQSSAAFNSNIRTFMGLYNPLASNSSVQDPLMLSYNYLTGEKGGTITLNRSNVITFGYLDSTLINTYVSAGTLNGLTNGVIVTAAGTELRSTGAAKLFSGQQGITTQLASTRPVGSSQFWQHNTDGTGEYKTPGQMAIINPIGGSNTLQAAIDSIAIAGGADGNGIYGGSGSLPSNVVVSGGNFGLTISTTEASTPGLTTSSPYTGLQASSTNGSTALYGITGNSSTTTILNSLSLLRNTSGTAGNGIGQSIALAHETNNGVPYTGNEIKSLWSNATTASRTSRFIVAGVNSGILADKFTIEGSGQVKFNAYTTNNQIGTGWGRFVAQADGTVAVDTTNLGDGNGIYGGSGSVPNGTTAATLGTFTLGNSLGNHLFIQNGNEAALYSDLSRVSVKDSVTISSAGSDGANGQVLIGTAGDGSYWGNAASLPVINPFGGVNTIQAALDSIGAGDNGIFSAVNNNDTIRVTTSTLKNNWTINSNNKSLTLNMTDGGGFTQSAIRIIEPVPTGSKIYTALQMDSGLNIRVDTAGHMMASAKPLELRAMVSSSYTSSLKFNTIGEAIFNSQLVQVPKLRFVDSLATSNVVIKPLASGSSSYTLTLPPNDGNAGQFLQTDGSGVTSWANASGGVATISEDTPFAYSSSITPVQMCYTDYSLLQGSVSTTGCTGGSADITNTSGSTKIMMVSSHGTISNAGAANWIDVEIYVGGSPSGVKQLIFVDASKSMSFNVTGNVSVNNNQRVDIRLRPGAGMGGTAAAYTINQISLTANIVY